MRIRCNSSTANFTKEGHFIIPTKHNQNKSPCGAGLADNSLAVAFLAGSRRGSAADHLSKKRYHSAESAGVCDFVANAVRTAQRIGLGHSGMKSQTPLSFAY